MTDQDPFPQPGDTEAYRRNQLDAMLAAIARQDGQGLLDLLKHIAAEVDQDLANDMLAALIEQAMTTIITGVRAGNPAYIAAAQRLLLI